MEERYKEILFEKYGGTKKHLVSRQEYFDMIDSLKKASGDNSIKPRHDYYLLNRLVINLLPFSFLYWGCDAPTLRQTILTFLENFVPAHNCRTAHDRRLSFAWIFF